MRKIFITIGTIFSILLQMGILIFFIQKKLLPKSFIYLVSEIVTDQSWFFITSMALFIYVYQLILIYKTGQNKDLRLAITILIVNTIICMGLLFLLFCVAGINLSF